MLEVPYRPISAMFSRESYVDGGIHTPSYTYKDVPLHIHPLVENAALCIPYY